MKNLLITAFAITAVIAISACTRQATPQPSPTPAPAEQQSNQVNAPDTTEAQTNNQPLATFAPTSDEDIKAMDKAMDAVDYNSVSSDSLSDI